MRDKASYMTAVMLMRLRAMTDDEESFLSFPFPFNMFDWRTFPICYVKPIEKGYRVHVHVPALCYIDETVQREEMPAFYTNPEEWKVEIQCLQRQTLAQEKKAKGPQVISLFRQITPCQSHAQRGKLCLINRQTLLFIDFCIVHGAVAVTVALDAIVVIFLIEVNSISHAVPLLVALLARRGRKISSELRVAVSTGH